MTTAEEILEKANRKKPKFIPTTHRAWNFEPESSKQNLEQNGNKMGTNLGIISNKNENNLVANKNINNNKWEQNGNETGNKNSNNLPLTKNPVEAPEFKTNTPAPLDLNNSYILKKLRLTSGLQNKIMRQIVSHIKNQPDKTYDVDILIDILAKNINTDKETTRVSIKRLKKKNLLIMLEGERGRHGCTKVRVPDFIVKKCFELFDDPPCGINEYRNVNGNINKNVLDSSSNININNTTTVTGKILNGWEKINYDSLKNIGFSDTQLLQLQGTKKCNPEVVQESINYLAFDLEQNGLAKKYSDPLNVFMGVMREGKAWRKPKDYESPQDKALRELLEEKKKAAEERKKKMDELLELHFDEWYQQQSDDFIKSLLPDVMRNNFNRLKTITVTTAKEHFKKSSIWENIISKFIPNCI